MNEEIARATTAAALALMPTFGQIEPAHLHQLDTAGERFRALTGQVWRSAAEDEEAARKGFSVGENA